MKFKAFIIQIIFFLSAVLLIYISACDNVTRYSDPPPAPAPNPYGDGNGKITFFRTAQIEGAISIQISNIQLSDTIIWQSAPACDTGIAASLILKAGNYSVSIEGAVFLCNYNVMIEERKCTLLDYTSCTGGYTGCYNLSGTWLRTADGPCPNCQGLLIQFQNGFGEVIYTPPGCRFPIGDIKWTDFVLNECMIQDLARDQYGGSPEYQSASITFFNKDSLIINGPSGVIPYSRILNEKTKIYKKNNSVSDSTLDDNFPVLQIAN
jgi:hypothetical protein